MRGQPPSPSKWCPGCFLKAAGGPGAPLGKASCKPAWNSRSLCSASAVTMLFSDANAMSLTVGNTVGTRPATPPPPSVACSRNELWPTQAWGGPCKGKAALPNVCQEHPPPNRHVAHVVLPHLPVTCPASVSMPGGCAGTLSRVGAELWRFLIHSELPIKEQADKA